MSSHDIHTLSGAYVMHALPDDEERFFEAHLTACEACRAEVAELRSTTAMLATAASEPAPSSLRTNVLAAIDVTRQESAPTALQPPRRHGVAWLATAAALVALVVGLGAVTARLNTRLQEQRTRIAEITAVLSADDVEVIAASGDGNETARLLTSAAQGRTVFVGSGLPQLPADRTLELWLIDDSGPEPAGIFEPDGEGRAVHIVADDLSGVDAVAVTVEPAGGSAQPTSDPFLVAEV